MKWQLEWGKYEEALRRRANKGREVPALKSQPKLFNDVKPAWELWNILHSHRQVGMDVSPLLVSDIIALINFRGVGDLDLLFDYILALEEEWLVWTRKSKSPKDADPPSRD